MIHVETQLPLETLLGSLGQLNATELDLVLQRVARLKAQQRTSQLSEQESALLLIINRGLLTAQQARLEELIRQRQAEELTDAELTELIALTDQAEQLQVERLEALVELAAVRGETPAAVMAALGLGKHAA